MNCSKLVEGYSDYRVWRDGTVERFRFGEWRPLKPEVTRLGYFRCCLYKERQRKRFLVHVLVAVAFIQRATSVMEVNHKDGNKGNNHADNLEWTTRRENMLHAYASGLIRKPLGSKNKLSKLNEQQVREIKTALCNYVPGMLADLGRKYGVTKEAIGMIRSGKNWKHVSQSKGFMLSRGAARHNA